MKKHVSAGGEDFLPADAIFCIICNGRGVCDAAQVLRRAASGRFMKIEKINDNQIRCTLTPEDLKSRDIRISELTYGSGKARSLFQEMMREAFRDYGFSVDNSPLMVEAVPDSGGNLTLIVTKVKDPEEIDSRFAHFTSDPSGDEYTFSSLAKDLTGADDILNLLTQRPSGNAPEKGTEGKESRPKAARRGSALVRPKGSKGAGDEHGSELNTMTEEELFGYTRFYMFHTLESVIDAARNISPDYAGGNTLFRNPDDGEYYLLIRKEDTEPERFNQICNVLSEYGLPMDFVKGTSEFFHEHMKVIVEKQAVQQLRTL